MNTLHPTPLYGLRTAIALLSVCTLLLNSCATMDLGRDIPASPTAEKPDISSSGSYQPALGAAASLYHQANHVAATGDYVKAEQLLERALRIEPKNSYYWYMLARFKYQQQQYSQVIQLCLKSKSIAGSDRRLLQMNDHLIHQAQNQVP